MFCRKDFTWPLCQSIHHEVRRQGCCWNTSRLHRSVPREATNERGPFRSENYRSCTDQISTSYTIIKQTIEMNLLLHIAFVDNDKVCDSSDKESLWKLMRNYRVLKKVLSLIKTTQRDMTCKVHEGKLTHLEWKQGCGKDAFCHHYYSYCL